MPRLHSLELLPDAAGEAVVRRDWQALREAGLPSMLDHAGETNTPHVTVIAVPAIGAEAERHAVDRLGPLLPVSAQLAGLAVLGERALTLVRLVDTDDAVVRAVLDLRSTTTGHRHPGWLAHATLARRLAPADLPRALDLVERRATPVVLSGLRRWDPDERTVRNLIA